MSTKRLPRFALLLLSCLVVALAGACGTSGGSSSDASPSGADARADSTSRRHDGGSDAPPA